MIFSSKLVWLLSTNLTFHLPLIIEILAQIVPRTSYLHFNKCIQCSFWILTTVLWMVQTLAPLLQNMRYISHCENVYTSAVNLLCIFIISNQQKTTSTLTCGYQLILHTRVSLGVQGDRHCSTRTNCFYFYFGSGR